MKRVICLSPGYVESQRVWKTFFLTRETYETEDDALNSLAEDLLELFKDEQESQFWRKCCKAVIGTDVKFCPSCGNKLSTSFSQDDLSSFVEDTLSSNANSFPGECSNWWPWNQMAELLAIPADQWVIVEDNWAESKMAARMMALHEGRPYDGR